MNNNETNTCVYKEYERLKGLFLGGNEDKLPLVDELLKKVAFLTVELRGLEKTIKKQGTVQVSNKGTTRRGLEKTIKKQGTVQVSNKGTTRTNPNLKSYLSMLSVYQGIIKTLNSILDTDITGEDDAFDEFMKKAIEER